jgi:hypothetical protein
MTVQWQKSQYRKLLRPLALTQKPATTTMAFRLLPKCVRACSALPTVCSEVHRLFRLTFLDGHDAYVG